MGMTWARSRAAALVAALLLAMLGTYCGGGGTAASSGTDPAATAQPPHPLRGETVSLLRFDNPYAYIPAQCYIETSRGTQNACQFCHTNGVYALGLGNNLPQAGASPRIGNLQTDYSFAPLDSQAPPAVLNRWRNTLAPEELALAVRALGVDPSAWDMQAWIRQDNWRSAFAQRPGDPRHWDGGQDSPFRLLPGLAPDDLPAQNDGFVRTAAAERTIFTDARGGNTGWRAINFMPYGIFTPHTGSVSGIYIRLPQAFMRDESGNWSLATYERNLDLVERAIQDRLTPADGTHYVGAARDVPLRRGAYPVGTEFAHPLHYVDVQADGRDPSVSPFPGTRARRVKEVRYMVKWKDFDHADFGPSQKEEGLPVYGNPSQGWVDNGVGWFLAGFIEDARGQLRPQRLEELTQCIGCHSGVNGSEINRSFTSGVGVTVDSTWAMARKFPGASGWREMDYLGYVARTDAAPDDTPGRASVGDPYNRREGKGEFRHFLDNVVGASLYGDMPPAIERFMASMVRSARGYAQDWPALDTADPARFAEVQARRQQLMRSFTARGEYLDTDHTIAGALLYPPRADALEAARRYRQVVATQRYTLGKDVFERTPVSFLYLRSDAESFTHADGSPYRVGERITDRSVERDDPSKDTYLVGNVATLIDPNRPYAAGGTYNPNYIPLLASPLRFER
ncbi:MAG: hypothetical protein ACUVVU_04905, partial [Tepidimonas sp.]|uniref:hypothetical protein n=1 Tax=Tepidimonas sp. TaxID=2002775 RepID=UPI004054C7AA